MSAERWRQVQEIFHAALAVAPEERDAFVASACGDNVQLKREVEELLVADAAEGDLLANAPGEVLREIAEEALREDASQTIEGRQIGPYTLVRVLGRGGMGTVYLAERSDVGLRCALKVVRGGLAGPEVIERMLFERRVLARLEHPHIARLIDAGVTADGTPWFAMELVDGQTIERFCEGRRLSVASRLQLFEKVCEAVAYAHRNLIVHRDLKPANVLVTNDGGPKLLDFGIAKLLEDQEEGLTGTGMRLLTPGYAAPEQLAAGPITTATDVYSLGLILYELLCGQPAFARDTRPLTLERRMHAVPTRPSAAAPPATRRQLAGDLDAIVMRALAPEPERRYGSAAELLEDVVRYRQALPVRARPDTWTYRARRFSRRNRAAVAIAALVVVMLSAFAGVTVVQEAQTARERDRAQTEAAKANQVSGFLTSLFDVADPFSPVAVRADSITLRDFLILRGEKISELRGQPEVQLQSLNVVGHMYFSLGMYDHAGRMFEQALSLGRGLYPNGDDELVTTLIHLGDLQRARGDYAASERSFRDAVAMAHALRAGVHESLARSLNGLGDGLRQSGQYAEAETVLREALTVRRQVHGERSTDAADGFNNLGLLLYLRGNYTEAGPMLDSALSIQRERLPPVHPQTSATLNNIGLLRKNGGDRPGAEAPLREALEIKRELFGRNHWRVANGVLNLAGLLAELDRLDEAEELATEALDITRAAFGDTHELTGAILARLGNIRERRGDPAGAERYYRLGLESHRRALPGAHPNITRAQFVLGRFLVAQQRTAEGCALLDSAASRYRSSHGENHKRTLDAEALLKQC